MRSGYMLIVTGFLAVSLTACNPSGGTDTSSTRSTTEATGSPSSTAIAVPEIRKGKITSRGDLCKLIPADKAAEVLGQPKLTKQVWKTTPGPTFLDACNLVHFDDKGTPDVFDDTDFVLNIFVRTDGAATLRLGRKVLASGNEEVKDYSIDGYDEAFYARREGNLRRGNMLYVANGAVGKQDGDRTMAFLTMLANAISR